MSAAILDTLFTPVLATPLYEVFNRMHDPWKKGWGRGATAYAIASHLGMSHRKAARILDELEAYNLVWHGERKHGVKTVKTYYLNTFGEKMLRLFIRAAESEKLTGQPTLITLGEKK